MMSNIVKIELLCSRSQEFINRFSKDDSGATSIEYGLILALMFLAIIGAVKTFGGTTNEMYTEIEVEINSVIN